MFVFEVQRNLDEYGMAVVSNPNSNHNQTELPQSFRAIHLLLSLFINTYISLLSRSSVWGMGQSTGARSDRASFIPPQNRIGTHRWPLTRQYRWKALEAKPPKPCQRW